MSVRQMIEEMIYDAVKSGDGPDSAMRIVDMFRALADEIDKLPRRAPMPQAPSAGQVVSEGGAELVPVPTDATG